MLVVVIIVSVVSSSILFSIFSSYKQHLWSGLLLQLTTNLWQILGLLLFLPSGLGEVFLLLGLLPGLELFLWTEGLWDLWEFTSSLVSNSEGLVLTGNLMGRMFSFGPSPIFENSKWEKINAQCPDLPICPSILSFPLNHSIVSGFWRSIVWTRSEDYYKFPFFLANHL